MLLDMKLLTNLTIIQKYTLIIAMGIFLGLFYYQDTIKANWIVFLTVARGILSPSCFWWSVSDSTTTDTTGVDLYNKLKKQPSADNSKSQSKMFQLNIMGVNVHVPTDVQYIQEILDQSPDIFGVGKFKYDFFKSFMQLNVGVSEGQEWKDRRALNEQVLDSDKPHRKMNSYDLTIQKLLSTKVPSNFDSFSIAGKILSSQIVFGESQQPYKAIYDMFAAANSMLPVVTGGVNIDEKLNDNYYRYMSKQLQSPKTGSLLSQIPDQCRLNTEEIIHQIPHWIFPINGTVAITIPRLLLVLYHHPKILDKLVETLKEFNTDYVRRCILEIFRLNNPVNSTFRTLLKDYQFYDGRRFPKDTQFLILNNPVMRQPDIFPRPNEFVPERWTKELEHSYHAIMFNQGPQRCPGKELIIGLISSFIRHYLIQTHVQIPQFTPKLDTTNIPQMINPCTIEFTFR